MKTRHCLVSNSSSSSFIVAYKKGEKCKCCGRGPNDLAEEIERNDRFGENEVYANGSSEVIGNINSSDFNDGVKLIDSILEIPKDWDVVYFKISHHDTMMIEYIEGIEKSGIGKILYRGEG